MKIFVGVYEHKHGRDIACYASRDLVENARRSIALQFWTEAFAEEPPADPVNLADSYFERMSERSGEYFEIEECDLVEA